METRPSRCEKLEERWRNKGVVDGGGDIQRSIHTFIPSLDVLGPSTLDDEGTRGRARTSKYGGPSSPVSLKLSQLEIRMSGLQK